MEEAIRRCSIAIVNPTARPRAESSAAAASRLYKDGDAWKDSSSFGRDDLPLVAKVTDLAHSWIFGVAPEQLATAAADF